MEKLIIYCGQKAKVACDEKCNKAWGGNNRPRVYMDIGEDKVFGLNGSSIYPDNQDGINLDDYAYLSDSELGDAPINPRTYEGGEAKPTNKNGIGNKWCVRECERCSMSAPDEFNDDLKLEDFSVRRYNFRSRNKE